MRQRTVSCCALCVLLTPLWGCSQASGPMTAGSSVVDAGAARGEPLDENVLKIEPDAPHRVIYVADISLVTRDFSAVERELPRLASQFAGYLSDVSIERQHGTQRTGRWTVRVPVGKFEEFLEAVSALGTAESRQQTAQDVSEEYVDLEARIANAKQLEQRIVQLLESRGGVLKDIIEVERELGRVREEIERMQGRIRYLNDRTALTTVRIAVREQHDYVPPHAPTFPQRLADSWEGSVRQLRTLGETTLVAAVAVVPWSWLAAAPLALIWYRRTHPRTPADSQSTRSPTAEP